MALANLADWNEEKAVSACGPAVASGRDGSYYAAVPQCWKEIRVQGEPEGAIC